MVGGWWWLRDAFPPSAATNVESRLLVLSSLLLFSALPMEHSYRSSRREAIVAGVITVVACIWVVGTCAALSYGQPVYSIGGVPNWALWGIFVPWLACLVTNIWYSLIYIRDDDEPEEPPSAGGAV